MSDKTLQLHSAELATLQAVNRFAVLRPVLPAPAGRVFPACVGLTTGLNPSEDGAVWFTGTHAKPDKQYRCPFVRIGVEVSVRDMLNKYRARARVEDVQVVRLSEMSAEDKALVCPNEILGRAWGQSVDKYLERLWDDEISNDCDVASPFSTNPWAWFIVLHRRPADK